MLHMSRRTLTTGHVCQFCLQTFPRKRDGQKHELNCSAQPQQHRKRVRVNDQTIMASGFDQAQKASADAFLADCCVLLDYHRVPEEALAFVLQFTRDAVERAVQVTASTHGLMTNGKLVTTALDAAIPAHLQQPSAIKRAAHKLAEELVRVNCTYEHAYIYIATYACNYAC